MFSQRSYSFLPPPTISFAYHHLLSLIFILHLCIALHASYSVYTVSNNFHTHKIPHTPHTQPMLEVTHLTPQILSHTSNHSTSKEQPPAHIADFVVPYPYSSQGRQVYLSLPEKEGNAFSQLQSPPYTVMVWTRGVCFVQDRTHIYLYEHWVCVGRADEVDRSECESSKLLCLGCVCWRRVVFW
jgi:hypothetical protein